ncbi:hypothetical protein BV898_11383 [Hypsibius exemplaris]|uniref:Uncharacterized protein n=1 Tax=Hypsibius exemplaris TaxID=2072580 RepID=A0A1W0WGS4_HYPEX|nr:hypothetical protein BV898_11383 [Hypsibius exemplaris]
MGTITMVIVPCRVRHRALQGAPSCRAKCATVLCRVRHRALQRAPPCSAEGATVPNLPSDSQRLPLLKLIY